MGHSSNLASELDGVIPGFSALTCMVLVMEQTDMGVGPLNPFPWYYPADSHPNCSPYEIQCLLRAPTQLGTRVTRFRAIVFSRRKVSQRVIGQTLSH